MKNFAELVGFCRRQGRRNAEDIGVKDTGGGGGAESTNLHVYGLTGTELLTRDPE